jgi:hypothetical protein
VRRSFNEVLCGRQVLLILFIYFIYSGPAALHPVVRQEVNRVEHRRLLMPPPDEPNVLTSAEDDKHSASSSHYEQLFLIPFPNDILGARKVQASWTLLHAVSLAEGAPHAEAARAFHLLVVYTAACPIVAT